MGQPKPRDAAIRERTLLAALLLSAWGPAATLYAVAVNPSATQIADCVRRSVELAALFLAWWTFRRLRTAANLPQESRTRLERRVRLASSAAMVVSGVAIVAVAAFRRQVAFASAVAWPGLTIAGLGLVTNTWFWRRYVRLIRGGPDAVLAAQVRLYAAKSLTDLAVVASLTAGAWLGVAGFGRLIDLAGSAIVACYLIWNGTAMAAGA